MNKLTQRLIKSLSGIDIKQLLAEKENLSVSNKQLVSDLSRMKQEVLYFRDLQKQKQEELDKVLLQLEELQASVDGLQQEVDAKEAVLLQQTLQVERLEKKVKNAETESAGADMALENLQKEVTVLKGEKSQSDKELFALKESLSLAEKQLQEKSAEFEKFRQQSAEEQEALKQVAAGKQDALAQQSADSQATLSSLQQELSETCLTKERMDKELSALKESLSSAEKLLQEKSAEFEKFRQQSAEEQEVLKLAAAGKQDELVQQYETLQKELAALKETLAQVEKETETIRQEASENYDKLVDWEDKSVSWNTEKLDLLKEKEQLAKNLSDKEETLKLQSEEIGAKSVELETLKGQLAETELIKDDLKAAQVLVKEQEEAMALLQKDAAEMVQLREQVKELDLLKGQIVSLKETVASNAHLAEELEEYRRADAGRVDEIAALNRLIAELKAQKESETLQPEEEVEKNLETVTSVEEVVKKNESKIEELQEVALQEEEVEDAVVASAGAADSEYVDEENADEAEGNLLYAYQEMQDRLKKSTSTHPYTRITTLPNGCQYIFESKTLQVKAELFTWGIEGKEVVKGEPHFISHSEVMTVEGLESPFMSDLLECDFSEEGNGEEVAETLLMAVCTYRPLHISYRDKNGRVSERNIYWMAFPLNSGSVKLPDSKLFQHLFGEKIDSERLVAMCAHSMESRIFTVSQILSIQVFDAFVTTERGIDAQRSGLKDALLSEQYEAADMIYQCIPNRLRDGFDVKSNRAHYYMLEGDFEKAADIYLSLAPDTKVNKKLSWARYNVQQFDQFIERNIQPDKFMQLKEALKAEGWKI